jgi:hypothetical protein
MIQRRTGGNALLLGTVAMLVTMAFHPTGHDFADPERFGWMTRLNVGVHALALFAIALTFAGSCALTTWLNENGESELPWFALVSAGFGSLAGMIAATLSGFVAPGLFGRIAVATAEGGATVDAWGRCPHLPTVSRAEFQRAQTRASAPRCVGQAPSPAHRESC